AHGVKVERIFLAAQLLGDASDRRASIIELAARSDAEIAESLRADSGHTALRELDAGRAEHLAAAFRHDCVAAHAYLAQIFENPPADRISAPVTVVVAPDDPTTAGYSSRYRDWQLMAENVELYELADGGHFFLSTRPREAAQIVLSALRSSAS